MGFFRRRPSIKPTPSTNETNSDLNNALIVNEALRRGWRDITAETRKHSPGPLSESWRFFQDPEMPGHVITVTGSDDQPISAVALNNYLNHFELSKKRRV